MASQHDEIEDQFDQIFASINTFVQKWFADKESEERDEKEQGPMYFLSAFAAQIMLESLLLVARHENDSCKSCEQHFVEKITDLSYDLLGDLGGDQQWLDGMDVRCIDIISTTNKTKQTEETTVHLQQQQPNLIATEEETAILKRSQNHTRYQHPRQSQLTTPRARHQVRRPAEHQWSSLHQKPLPRPSDRRNPPSIILTRIRDKDLLRANRKHLNRIWTGWCGDVFGDNVPPKFDFANIDEVSSRGSTALEISFFERPKKALLDVFVDGLRNNTTCRVFIYKSNYVSPPRQQQIEHSPRLLNKFTSPDERFIPSRNFDSKTPQSRSGYGRNQRFFTPDNTSPARPNKLNFQHRQIYSDRNDSRSFSWRRFPPNPRPSNYSRSPGWNNKSFTSFETTKLQQIESKMNYLLDFFERMF